MCSYAFTFALYLAAQHGPQTQMTTPCIHFFQRLLDLFLLYLGQKTQGSQINAENWNIRARYATCCREHRAIASQDNHEIGRDSGQLFPLCRFAVRTKFTGGCISSDGVAVIAKPACHLVDNPAQIRLALLGDDGCFLHQNSARNRNSRFPSIPRIGDSINSMFLPPSSSTFCRTLLTALC